MKCAHCKSDHKYNFEVRECARQEAARQSNMRANLEQFARKPQEVPTAQQLQYISDLMEKKGIRGVKAPETRRQASNTIEYLKKQPDKPKDSSPAAIISYHVTNIIKDGRYAVQIGPDNPQHIFVWVQRPTTGGYKGKLVVKTQHGENYVRRLVFNQTTSAVEFQNNATIDGKNRIGDAINAIVPDQNTAAMQYAVKMERCFRCGRELTDDRSTYYGIGPECEKVLPGYIAWVHDTKGPYAGGK